ncbi:ribosomal protein L22 [Mytilinidion resinicola]|uniref:Ribosomal protein L22 n=1 Tax=Mytilinidion resinicola TaxID=574789 RepID=A0A6A6YWH1_9PEZI|nr:ribosomal protein L22 [Mytilinidion resinicola]KAF2812247.1 ribosomal protein L22 [Mytilinidion resinicola]
MSMRIPSRQLARPAAVLNGLRTAFLPIRTLTSSAPRNADKKNDKKTTKKADNHDDAATSEQNWNPILAQYNAKQEASKPKPTSKTAAIAPRPFVPPGSLPPTSIFDVVPERTAAEKAVLERRAKLDRLYQTDAPGLPSTTEPAEEQPTTAAAAAAAAAAEQDADEPAKLLDRRIAAFALDPNPAARRRWERKRVIRTIARRGRLSKTELLARTERRADFKSPFLNTSVKKLTKLANQIAGKPVAQALVQMRFSKKKVAREVLRALEMARDAAVVKHGMGLGKAEGRTGGAVEVEDRHGRKRVVRDRTEMYVEQAWVGRGAYAKSMMARARGRADVLRHPTTSISFVLKEEATRIRLSEEYKKKRDNRKLWVQLPDRPITAQRQYALW